MNRWLLTVAVAACAACEIPADDLLPGFGAPCDVTAAECPIEHVCEPSAPDAQAGVCVPVESYGSCTAPTWPPGRFGKVEDAALLIDDVEEQPRLDNVKQVSGDLTFNHPTGSLEFEVDDICNLRTLQRVDGTLLIANTTLETLDGLQALTSAKSVGIVSNDNLEDISALSQLVSVEGCLVFGEQLGIVIAQNRHLSDDAIAAFSASLSPQQQALFFHCGNKSDAVCPDAFRIAERINNQGEICADE